MFKLGNSKLSNLISAFDDFKLKSKKHSQSQAKAFGSLKEWAFDTNNTAFQDVTSKLDTLFSKIDADMHKEKLNAIKEINHMFKKFKEYDAKSSKLFQNTKIAERIERRYFIELNKCPMSKNIRDYELRYIKAKEERESAELKFYEYSQEIDATKTILFKTQMKRLNDTLMRQNEAEKVLLNAMNDLVDKIPDVSNEEVDDINMISYTNQTQTHYICTEAKRKLNRLSSSAYGIKLENINSLGEDTASSNSEENHYNPNQANEVLNKDTNVRRDHFLTNEKENENYLLKQSNESIVAITDKLSSLKTSSITTRRNKTRISCPPKIALCKIDETSRLYPYLPPPSLVDEQHLAPPPTYSDSESFYSSTLTKVSSNDNDQSKKVRPSAPTLN